MGAEFVNGARAAGIDVATARADVAALLKTGIFSSEEAAGPIFKASYVWLILNVNTMLVALDEVGHRIALSDNDEDVTELIRRARYAIVHSAAKPRRKATVDDEPSYIVAVGALSGFDDDISVELGGVRVLIRRYAVRAYELACAALGTTSV